MYRWDPHALLRHYLEQQYSVTAIAAAFGSDRRTAQRWIATGDPDRDPRAPLRAPTAGPPQLDPCKPLIGQRPDTYPLLTAVRLFEEVLAAEYAGSAAAGARARDPLRDRTGQPSAGRLR
jgi:hypothetical protein